ncbi:MAG TPA: phosphonate ABC transporter, permease protein PhnE [Rhodospirillales bacterium]
MNIERDRQAAAIRRPGQTVEGDTPPRTWSRFKYPDSLIRYGVFLATLVFLAYSLVYMDVKVDRLLELFSRVGALLADRYYPPDLSLLRQPLYLESVVETVQMAYLGALFGLLLSVPLAWVAAFNVTPYRFLYPCGRLAIMACRAVHEMIWTILFVSILGFGMLAGVLALTMFCIGFAGKLFSEEIEAIDMGPVEAIRAVGGNSLQVFVYAVLPQVRVAWTGIAIYTWDVGFRAATVVGFFGAGGMGWYLLRHVQQLENQQVAAILISIIVLVIVSETVSAWARNRVSRAR